MTIVIAVKSRKRKTLDYMVIDDVRILSEHSAGMRSDIVVTVGGDALTDPRIITVRYLNTGNKEIFEADFLANSITTTDASGTKNSKIAGKSDENIQVTEAGVVPHKSYSVDCLNRGEFLDIQYIVDMDGVDDAMPFSPVCRIAGATRPPKLIEQRFTREYVIEVLKRFWSASSTSVAETAASPVGI